MSGCNLYALGVAARMAPKISKSDTTVFLEKFNGIADRAIEDAMAHSDWAASNREMAEIYRITSELNMRGLKRGPRMVNPSESPRYAYAMAEAYYETLTPPEDI